MSEHGYAAGRLNLPFVGISTFGKRPYVADWDALDADVAVLGAPYDFGTQWRPGARFGPRAVREASTLFSFGHAGAYDHEDDATYLASDVSIVDIGDADIIHTKTEESHANIEFGVRKILAAGALPVVIGGDHSINIPCINAFSEQEPVHDTTLMQESSSNDKSSADESSIRGGNGLKATASIFPDGHNDVFDIGVGIDTMSDVNLALREILHNVRSVEMDEVHRTAGTTSFSEEGTLNVWQEGKMTPVPALVADRAHLPRDCQALFGVPAIRDLGIMLDEQKLTQGAPIICYLGEKHLRRWWDFPFINF